MFFSVRSSGKRYDQSAYGYPRCMDRCPAPTGMLGKQIYWKCGYQASALSRIRSFPKHELQVPHCDEEGNFQGTQESLERRADLLNKVQKALDEYLERERASFPRFHFLGEKDS